MKETNQKPQLPKPTPSRFSVDKNGDIEVKAKISESDLSDLPRSIAEFTRQIFVLNLPQVAKDGYFTILEVLCNFFPDEVEQRQIHKELRDYRREQGY